MPIGLYYTTRTYRLGPDPLGGALASLHAPTPDQPRGGVLARLEGDRWMVTLAGVCGDRPPADPDGFLAFARSLPFPEVHRSIAAGRPLDDGATYHFPASVRRRFERLDRFPRGFLVLGDGICGFKTVYGQGMSVAATQALALRRHVDRGPDAPARPYLRDVARLIDVAWEMGLGADLAFPGVAGRRSRGQRHLGGYLARLSAAAGRDAEPARSFVRVAGLVERPTALLRPGTVARVLAGGRAGRAV